MSALLSHDPDAPRWHFEAERPVDPHTLIALADVCGTVAEWSPTTQWAHVDVDVLMRHIVRVASAPGLLSAQQLRCFVATFVERKSAQTIADELGCHRSNVAQSLHGHTRRDGWWRTASMKPTVPDRGRIHSGGSVVKVKAALSDDAEFLAAVAATKSVPDGPSELVRWFAPAKANSKSHLAAPLLTLLLMREHADARGRVLLADVLGTMSGSLLNGTLTQMKVLGWVATDGIHATILRTPVDPAEDRRIS